MSVDLDRPIIIVSAGRSGSTVLHEMLSRHPHVSWLSSTLARAPERPGRNRQVLRASGLPWVGELVRRRFPPDECYGFWDRHFPGFSRPFRDLGADDLTERVRHRLREALESVSAVDRPRLLVKITGWPRIGFLGELLPGARFIHLVRDGRAVASSLLEVSWWRGWRGPSGWRFGELRAEERERWEASGRSFLALAGLAWTRILDAVAVAASELPAGRLMEVRYEELCQDHVRCLRRIAEFCALEWKDEFSSALQAFELRSTNDRWRRDLTAEQQGVITRITRSHLEARGYL
ncbi:MAG: sulfotransferase [Gemmatimonadota bacterium]